jgi:hypothetical protein
VSDPTDIKALDEYLKGNSDISQRYRELGRDDVPPELDRRVLAQAHAAVAKDGAQRSRSWLRWSAPVALAASVVLVVTVVIESGVPKDSAYVVQPASEESKLYDEQPAPRAAEPAQESQFVPEAPAPAPARSLQKKAEVQDQRAVSEEVRVEANAKMRRDQAESALPRTTDAVPADSAEPQVGTVNAAPVMLPQASSVQEISARETSERTEAEADSDVSSVSVTGSRARRATGRTAGPRNTISGAALSGETRQNADASADTDPPKWLEQIRELRRKGRIAEADREWQRFSEAYPDFEVAEDDIARKH